jgi:hypothetical protein
VQKILGVLLRQHRARIRGLEVEVPAQLLHLGAIRSAPGTGVIL